MRFVKYQALGNDYVVLEEAAAEPNITRDRIAALCARHTGIGADGVLVRVAPEGDGDERVRIFNPDGSEAEKSGNGLRIFARYLYDEGRVGDEAFTVETAGGKVSCVILDAGAQVEVEMGRVSFDSAEIPVLGERREVLREAITVADVELEFSAASIGNPHCVILRKWVSTAETKALGPTIETDPRFPNRTNVQFLQVLDRRNLRLEIWERGAGYTPASGSSSCAAAAVARRLDLCEASVTMHMPGGRLAIEVGESFDVRMTGPVARVVAGVVSDELFTRTAAVA